MARVAGSPSRGRSSSTFRGGAGGPGPGLAGGQPHPAAVDGARGGGGGGGKPPPLFPPPRPARRPPAAPRAGRTAPTRISHVLVGTSGFSYPAWRGSFYPED